MRKLLLTLLLAALPALSSAQIKTSALPAATTPLTGAEVFPCVQSGVTDKCTTQSVANIVSSGFKVPVILQQTGLPIGIPPSGFMTATGGIVIGQAPSSAATVSFSATSGAGVTMTFSAATLLGTAAEVGRVLTILDTTYKYATITTQVSTTVATVTLTGTLSGTGPFANNTIWLSGTVSTNGSFSNTTAFSVPFFVVYPNIWLYFPASSPIGVAGVYFCQMASTTVGTCFNNKLNANTLPTVIGSPTAFSGLTPAAYTQSTSVQTLTSANVPANSMGVNGMLIVDVSSLYPNTAGGKTTCVSLGNSPCVTATYTTTTMARWQPRISNNGVANSQFVDNTIAGFGTNGNGALSVGRFTQNTTGALSLQLWGSVAAATDFYVAEAYSMQEWPN